MTTKNITITNEIITGKIHLLQNQKILLYRVLAVFYGVHTRRLREKIKRNLDRFPPTFKFQLTENEIEHIVSQNAIPSISHLGGTSPYAFTEHGIFIPSLRIVAIAAFKLNKESLSVKLNLFKRSDTAVRSEGAEA